MKRILLLIVLAVIADFQASAQSYNGPESIEFDPNDGSYFVANANNGTMVKLSPSGTLSSFASGINFPTGPHGIELIADTLYACDGGTLKMINRASGTLIASISMGATFLNGITHKGNNLYITDFSAKKIHRFNVLTRQHNIFCSTISSKTPNGIIYDDINDRLVYCCWGSNAPVHAINLSDSTVSSIGTTTLGNCDGITMNCSGEYYIASWSPSRVTKFNSTFSSSSIFASTGISSPADIYYNRMQDSLYVPNTANNTVSKLGDVSCLVSLQEVEDGTNTNVFPNPAKDMVYIKNAAWQNSKCIIYDLQGREVISKMLSEEVNSVDLSGLLSGVYFVAVKEKASIRYIKLIKE